MKYFLLSLLLSISFSQVQYNHPELNWHTFETDHFKIHFHDETEQTAREAATVAETIYPHVTSLYEYEPPTKTHLVLIDPDDYSNGAAYYYDNKMVIWASPLDFELRGSHRWLQNVITHEFTHIVSLQKAMKADLSFPGAYFQFMGYEKEKRKDVLYGFPNVLASFPVPGTVVPPWLAEGVAQYMYEGADWDHWDSHRDMILRDRSLNDNFLSFDEINTFGKRGIGNESTYNTGFAFCKYIAVKYGADKLRIIMEDLSTPLQFSISDALYNVLGEDGFFIYERFLESLNARYHLLTNPININPVTGIIIKDIGTFNAHPIWNPQGTGFAWLSNRNNDYFGQTELFFHDFNTNEEKKLMGGVHSAPTWHSNGKMIYYSKKALFPNKNGSRFYDIYEYNLETEEELRLTHDARSFSPVFIPRDSTIAYLSTYDGGQNIFLLHLKSDSLEQITFFDHRPIISSLSYNATNHQLVFSVTEHHYRNIQYHDLESDSIGILLNNSLWDERDIQVTQMGELLYSDDRTGIYNLYIKNEVDNTQGFITNLLGGAFMPHMNQNGQILYSLYENGGYKIALLDSISPMEDEFIGYSPTYYLRNSDLNDPIVKKDESVSIPYVDQFPKMFILPKLMVDYGTTKPGFYFYSNEILDRLNVFGGASLNNIKDTDLFFIFEFRRFFPTLFFETFYLTRNITDSYTYKGTYPINDQIKFRLTFFRAGMRLPFYGSQFEFYSIWQRYRAFISESIPTEGLTGGISYDYYRSTSIGFNWNLDLVKRRYDKNINPSKGYKVWTSLDIEKNEFIEGIDFSDAGSLKEVYAPNNHLKWQGGGDYHFELPNTERWTLNTSAKAGFTYSSTEIDSFFHFFNGGLTGLKGYPFYSVEGTRFALLETTFRFPLFTEQNYLFGWTQFQNSYLGLMFQVGDAWSQNKEINLKKSIGIQWRINGFSFYNFPTAIGVEIHKGMDDFIKTVKGQEILYGNEPTYYFSLLFNY
ncbi:MAG: hypothetical protein HOD28_02430 [Candidatus Marinimicrobia bacterium]|nr:hypothetical protein [Candidatus Neomarinimicrobiota bacterium]MBT4382443.1 hypothetical protein [Candidatus Neomarinimicrobiota bacterium]MBT6940717.1 hypothetical protein [Candidatus Neomarinimicrobiota bacterium]MBT7269794.1 hypothetical protein [Candidatus Neomarinimicrobiota bacterium]